MRYLWKVILLMILLTGCSKQAAYDFTTWNDNKVLSYLNEVNTYIQTIPLESDSKEHIVHLYEFYFSPELSKQIVDSLYNEYDGLWKVPDGDAGFIFVVPNKDQHEVTISYSHDSITIEEHYAPESWTHSKLTYTITYDKKPLISAWQMVN